jgi:hypothetical protein
MTKILKSVSLLVAIGMASKVKSNRFCEVDSTKVGA